jgi:DHA2 family methylenomycin A resistance protein-like MFS transporter
MIETRTEISVAALKKAHVKGSMDRWRLFLFMAATSLGYFVVQLDVSIVNLSLPTIQNYYHTDVSTLQWVVNAYTLSFSILLLSAGVLGDRYGSKNCLILGYAIFFVGSFACGAAPTISWLLAARFFQGVGAAIIVPNSLAVINWSFSENKNLRLVQISIWMAFGGAALTCGPIFGGIITSIASWRYIFFINIPVCLVGIFLTARYVEETPSRKSRQQDWIGQGLMLLFSASLLVFIINYADISNGAKAGIVALAAIVFGMFILVEKRQSDPAIPLEIFGNPRLQQALIFGVLVNFVYFGIVFFVSLYFRYHLEMTALQAGLSFIPITLPLIASNLLSGKISRVYGPDRSIMIGFALMIPGMLYLALPPLRTGYGLMLPAFALISFGVGFITPMITAVAMSSIGPERGGMISAVVNFFRQISGAFGVAVFGIFMTSTTEEVSYGYFGVALVVLAVALLVSIWFFAGARKRGANLL